MPKPIEWSEADDSTIRDMRERSEKWDSIASVLGYARETVLSRAKAIGLNTERKCAPSVHARPENDAPLPAGHPDTWGMLLRLTPSLAGTPYPHPVFAQ